ncbi:MAG: hypothetical protein RI897_3073 [Verrucomicrobiota bacterium]|jgi:hypothetical protein
MEPDGIAVVQKAWFVGDLVVAEGFQCGWGWGMSSSASGKHSGSCPQRVLILPLSKGVLPLNAAV